MSRSKKFGRNGRPRLRIISFVLLLARVVVAAPDQHPIAAPGNCELEPGLEISLFAREPDVVDPVAITFDEEGRAYAVEMGDYPLGIGPDHRPGGTVRLLEDSDGDGRADRSVVFAEQLRFPTSILPWNGGVLVTAPPEILFLKDTDGDGKADVREVLFKGFTLGVTDSNVNGLRWGLDNRVHGCNGGNGGEVISTRKAGPAVSIQNLDFSFEPGPGDFTPTYQTSGGFGLVFDDWGRSFVTYNINHIQHRVMPVRYLNHFPGLPPVEVTVNISDHGEAARIYPISEAETRVNHPEQAGHFSSAGGMGYITGREFPAPLRESILVCDVVGNLVHRDMIQPEGPSFVARRPPGNERREFFASRDNAFRPVGLELGPDGALYLMDMQRDVIEHPDYIPEKVKQKLDLRAGEDRGRIYRITPTGGLPSRKPRLRNAASEKLVGYLSDSNPWWRTTAQRLIVERQDKAVVGRLKDLAAKGTQPLGRLHALWTLRGLGSLDESLIAGALDDAEPGVREQALVLCEGPLGKFPNIQKRIVAALSDSAVRVRFQAALTIGEIGPSATVSELRTLLIRDPNARWMRIAVLTASRLEEPSVMLGELLDDPAFTLQFGDGKLALFRELADLAGARTSSSLRSSDLLKPITTSRLPDSVRIAILDGFEGGLKRASWKGDPGPQMSRALETILATGSPAIVAAAWKLSNRLGLPEGKTQQRALAEALQVVPNGSKPLSERLEQVRVLALAGYDKVGAPLVALLDSEQPTELQRAAIEALRQFDQLGVARGLVDRWHELSSSTRLPALNLLLQRESFHPFLLDAIESGRVTLGELNLDLEQRRVLLRESTPEVRARAAKLMGDEEYSNRKAIVTEWLAKLPPTGDPQRGRVTFERVCAQCHLSGDVGQRVGPELTELSHRSVEDIASNILDPNMAINPSYVSFTVHLNSGEIETGILQSESSEAVTLRQAQERVVVIPRKSIRQIRSTGISLMPEGLEAGLTAGDLRDLIAFLQRRQ